MPYKNPVIPGFYPDPSAICVGSDYYLVTSSFEYFPGVPVFHSRDLVNWRQIGHCLSRPSQLPLAHAAVSGGIFAPTIRHHNGRFYMITTNSTAGGNFFVSTDDPAGQWSEPVWVKQPGIDSSMLFDDDGKVYFQSTGKNDGIYQSQLDVATGSLLSEPRRIWPGMGGRYPEAPHLYRINGLYYLMIAEGGTEYGHSETIARSTSPWGPFEPCPHNPIITHRDWNRQRSPIQGTGHADLVQAHDGSWWLVFLAFRPVGGFFHHIGRETFLAPVSWTSDGWPVVNRHGTVDLDMPVPTLPLHPWPAEPVRDDFDSPALRLPWNFLRNPDPADWSLADRPGWLRLTGSPLTLDDLDAPAFLGRRQQHFSFQASTLLDFQPASPTDEAGLSVFHNNLFHYDLAVTPAPSGQGRRILFRRRLGDLTAVVAERPLPPGPVTLSVCADPLSYHFSYSVAGSPTQPLGDAWTRFLSSEVAGGFTGTYLALYATGNRRRSSSNAHFDWFDCSPADPQ